MKIFAGHLDARYFQIGFQCLFLAYGILYLDWDTNWLHYFTSISGCLLFTFIFEVIRKRNSFSYFVLGQSCLSVMISALSICLLLKTNHWYTSLLAAFFTVTGKYFIRYKGHHLFNPSALGIVLTLWLTNDAWLSPGQWGSTALLFFWVLTLGIIVTTRVQNLDTSIAFLLSYGLLLYWRQVVVLGWPADHFFHSLQSGSLLLFSFFMISDPKTSPHHPMARRAWAILIAVVAFYLSAFQWKYNTPIWVLVAAAPLVPLLNACLKGKIFEWNSNFQTPIISSLK